MRHYRYSQESLLLLLLLVCKTSSFLRMPLLVRWKHRAAYDTRTKEHPSSRQNVGLSVMAACAVLESNEFPQIAIDLAERLSLPLLSLYSDGASRNGGTTTTTYALTVVLHSVGVEGREDGYAIGIGALEEDHKKNKRSLSTKPLIVDFCPPMTSALGQRTLGDQGPDLLSQAVGPRKHAVIYDLTAGLGQDSLILAHAGAQRVHMVEQNPIVASLLLDAMRRLHVAAHETKDGIGASTNTGSRSESALAKHLLECLSVQQGDGVDVVNELRPCRDETTILLPDVVYLDPMFPIRRKRAAVKKNMQILHGLLESQETSDEVRLAREESLLTAGLATAQCRVVVKRPVNAPFLASSECSHNPLYRPSFQVTGSVSRWDVYVIK